jgi:hypothetical protein
MVQGLLTQRIEQLRERIAATSARTRTLVRDARGLRESSRERMHRFCEHQQRLAFAERRLMRRVGG